jgi:hypothetical protein
MLAKQYPPPFLAKFLVSERNTLQQRCNHSVKLKKRGNQEKASPPPHTHTQNITRTYTRWGREDKREKDPFYSTECEYIQWGRYPPAELL